MNKPVIQNKNKNKQTLLFCLALLIIGTVSFFYWGSKKQVWFCDEIYTYESANGFEQDWPAAYTAEWMTGDDVEAFLAADSDHLSLNSISVRLYNDHVPLYFWLFRIVSYFFFRGSGSIWIGLSINLVFYILFSGSIYCIFLRLTDHPLLSGIVTFLTCISNRLMIEQATTLRMYIMLLYAELLLLLAGVWIMCKIDRGKISPGICVYLFCVSVFGFLTHYDYWIFYAITATVFCLYFLVLAVGKYKKNFWRSWEFRYVVIWTINFGISLFVTTLLFPYCKWNLKRGKGLTALESIFVFSSEKADQIIWGYQRLVASLFGDSFPTIPGLLIMFGCIAGGLFLLFQKKKIKQLTVLVIVVLIAQAYQVVVCFTLPDVWEERYLWGVFTFMMLCMAWSGTLILQAVFLKIQTMKTWRILYGIISAALIVSIMLAEMAVIDSGNGVAYLFHPNKNVSVLEENQHVPWIVYGPTGGVYSYYDWLLPDQICFLTQDNTPEDILAVKKLVDQDAFVLYLFEAYLPQALDFFSSQLNKELTAMHLTDSTNLSVYLIKVN